MASRGLSGVDVRYIEPGTPEYERAKEVRYRELYDDLDLPRSLVEDTDGRTYLHLAAFKGGEVIGYARLHLERGESKVFQVCVDRRFQGRGIARALMLELIDCARREGRKEITLDAREHAIGLYEKLGFEPLGERFLSARTNTPHIFMRLPLDCE